ncbi:MAG: response regulator, partial [Treponema sp.]|nr:response regulator [Treponema sp.]
MKQVLVIDEAPLFRDYLQAKLGENNIDVDMAVNSQDGLAKLRNIAPDLLVLDYNLKNQGCMEMLKQKKASSALAPIPVIITARQIDQKKILEMVPYNVKKVFTKPVKIDTFLETTQEILN